MGDSPTTYRKNVAVFVINDRGELLACHRSDVSGAWQIPQGGIDEGEELEQAMRRELEEEIGTSEVEIIQQLPEAIRYDWPAHLHDRGFLGQEQFYFLVRLSPTATIKLNNHHTEEFDQTEWISSADFLRRISGFKAEAYKRALGELARLAPGTIA